MNTDNQDISQFQAAALETLSRKILGVRPIMQMIINPNFGKVCRVDLVRHSATSWTLEKMVWDRPADLGRLSDPLEKVKLLGKFSPTFERESLPLAHPEAKRILHNLKQIASQEQEYFIEGPTTGSKDAHYSLWLDDSAGKELSLEWQLAPQEWTLIPQLLKEIKEKAAISDDK